MKKELVISSIVFVLLAFAIIVAAENLGSQNTVQGVAMPIVKPIIPRFELLGRGIVVSINNPQDFKLIKIGILRLPLMRPTPIPEDELIGVLLLDNNKYRLKNGVIEDGHAKAEIYLNNTKIGNINISLVKKGNARIWFGELSIITPNSNNERYNVYILEERARITPLNVPSPR